MLKLEDVKIAVIGLGYVGLPLAIAFAESGFEVVGFDVNESRVQELTGGFDATGEVDMASVTRGAHVSFSSKESDLGSANVYIVTVPTPINDFKVPDLSPLKNASKTIATFLNQGDTVIYESTVYPGCTEEVCVPILEEGAGSKLNREFFVGYSPERINPGDKQRSLAQIVKVVSGSSEAATDLIEQLYSQIIVAGVHRASSIKVAEAAKVIENTQRDLNIALINELAMLFDKLGIPTTDVLDAAATKWNFLNFRPGLVGGHCIGVDPYYLTHKARSVDFNSELVLAGRRTNDNMASWIAGRLIKEMTRRQLNPARSRVLIMGLTFKENCPDTRNTKVVDLISELADFNCQIDVCDPLADKEIVVKEYGISLTPNAELSKYDLIVLAVAHDEYVAMEEEEFVDLLKSDGFIFDLKGVLPENPEFIRL